jgi:ribonuclease G
MYKQILINMESQEKRVAVLEGNNLEEYYVERQDQHKIVGNVYKGIVSAILPGMAAAFVSLGLKKDGFLHVSDVVDRPPDLDELISEPLAEDEERQRQKKKRRDRAPNITV